MSDEKELKQGTRANLSGKMLEKLVIPMFCNYGYDVIQYSDVKKNPDIANKDKTIICNIPFTSIYNHRGKTEYLIINNHGEKWRVEAKNQQSAGSVDEKLSYLLLNTIYSYPEDNVILLIEGSGWKEGSLIWIKNAVKKYNVNFDIYEQSLRILQPMLAPNQKPLTKKRILVMNTSEFIAFFQKNFTD